MFDNIYRDQSVTSVTLSTDITLTSRREFNLDNAYQPSTADDSIRVKILTHEECPLFVQFSTGQCGWRVKGVAKVVGFIYIGPKKFYWTRVNFTYYNHNERSSLNWIFLNNSRVFFLNIKIFFQI